MKEKITILIADDNIDFTRTLSAYLEKMEDIEVVGIAKDGNEAFEIIKGTHPDYFITRCNNATFRWNWSFRKA